MGYGRVSHNYVARHTCGNAEEITADGEEAIVEGRRQDEQKLLDRIAALESEVKRLKEEACKKE